MFKLLVTSFYHEIDWVPGLGYLLKLFVFERDSDFWKKRNLMLTFNFGFQNCQKFVP